LISWRKFLNKNLNYSKFHEIDYLSRKNNVGVTLLLKK
jgi:hypothetical protein